MGHFRLDRKAAGREKRGASRDYWAIVAEETNGVAVQALDSISSVDRALSAQLVERVGDRLTRDGCTDN